MHTVCQLAGIRARASTLLLITNDSSLLLVLTSVGSSLPVALEPQRL